MRLKLGRGRRIGMCDLGSGSPTVIFEYGLAASSPSWAGLQNALRNETRTFRYDRCRNRAMPRTPSCLARELREILDRAGIPPPYLLVAHSFGALVARRFAADAPDEAAGVILLDPLRVEEWRRWSESRRRLFERSARLMKRMILLAQLGGVRLAAHSVLRHNGQLPRRLAAVVGEEGCRVLERTTSELAAMPRAARAEVIAEWSTPGYYRSVAAHLRSLPDSLAEMEQLAPLEDVPMLVLTPASGGPLSRAALARLGRGAEQWTVEGTGHWIHLDRPDVVLEAIRSLLSNPRWRYGRVDPVQCRRNR